MDNIIKDLYIQREEKVNLIFDEIKNHTDDNIKYFEYDIKWILFDVFDNDFIYTIKDKIRDKYIKERKHIKGEIPIIKDKIVFVGELFYPYFNTLKWRKKQKGNIVLPYKEYKKVKIRMDFNKIEKILISHFSKRLTKDIMDKIRFYVDKRWNMMHNLGISFEQFITKNGIEKVVFMQDRRKEYRLFVDICKRRNIKTVVYQHGLTPYKEYMPMSDLSYVPLYADNMVVWGKAGKEYMMSKGTEDDRIIVAGNFKWKEYEKIKNKPLYNVYIQNQLIGLKEWERKIENILKNAVDNTWISKERGRGIDLKIKKYKGDIKDVMKISRCGITPFSTGALDFYFANIPVIILSPFNEDPCGLKEIFSSASSSDELKEKLKNPTYPDRNRVEGLFGKPIYHKELQEIINKI